MKILSVENLSRSFGGIKANNDISFEVTEGTICLLYTSDAADE